MAAATSVVLQRVDELFVVAEPTAPLAPSATVLDAFIDQEIARRQRRNVSWKYMEACFKWRMVQQYLQEQGVLAQSPVTGQLRELLRCNKLLRVEYDTHSHRILKLNYGDL